MHKVKLYQTTCYDHVENISYDAGHDWEIVDEKRLRELGVK